MRWEKTTTRKNNGKGGDSGDGRIIVDRRTTAGCRESHISLNSARKVNSSADSDSPDGVRARVDFSSESVLSQLIEVTSATSWQKHVTAK